VSSQHRAGPESTDGLALSLRELRERSAGAGRQLGAGGVRALAAVAAVVAVIAAVLAWRARPAIEPVTPPALAPQVASASPSEVVIVAVSGKVRRPGLVHLPSGARVADAIEAAGGALPGTDLSMINLARKVTDGELIVVGITPPPGPSAPGAPDAGSGVVNLNTATSEQLQSLPGVGPVLAQRIIEYRDQHGGFTSVADLRKVTGIGDARYGELKDRVTV
jgi:competence protein ComEA